MKRFLCTLLAISGSLMPVAQPKAGVLFPDPPGGWSYLFGGDQLQVGEAGSGFSSLDGTWSHDNGSDEWDGSPIGGALGPTNRPGGISLINEGGLQYIRIQDTGDPRDYGFTDPGTNRKLYLGHSMTADGAADAQMDDGITLTFRARIPTSGVLDPLHRDGQQAGGTKTYPADGDGYVTSDSGKGNFVLKQASGGAIAFSFTTTADNPSGDPADRPANFKGLTMNEFAGNTISANVNFGQGTGTNVIAFDPTQWHELWIVLKKDPANIGTHQAFIYVDGSLTPKAFKVTAGTGDDYGGISYLAIGSTATPQNSALDVDFVGFKLGAHCPPGFAEPAGGWTYVYNGDKADAGAAGSGFTSLDGLWSHDNGSDEWDGSAPGGELGASNRPGGVGSFEEGGVQFLRIQDTGDPRDYGYADPGSNRKIYLGHDMSSLGASTAQLDEGLTLSFRARIPTPSKSKSPLDSLHRDGQQAGGVKPYPADGDGYVTSDSGKGNFVLAQSSGGAIAFSLTTTTDNPGGDPADRPANFKGLTMNEFAGNTVSANVNFGQGTGTNVVAFDPTDWHTFWITLRKDPANIGTHQGFVYLDGNLTPTVFRITAGTGNDFSGLTYLAVGSTATPQNSALDIDFVAYKLGAVFPGDALDNLPPEILEVSPAAGTGYHPAAQGLSFKATTQGNNELHPAGIKLFLNGTDLSQGLVVTGTPKERLVSLSSLSGNQFYVGEIVVSDQAGRSTTNRVEFDTLVQEQITVVPVTAYGEFEATLPSSSARLLLRASATDRQLIKVERVVGGSATLLGVFKVPRSTGTLVRLTDIFGAPVIVDTAGGGASTLRLSPASRGASTPSEVWVVPDSAPPTQPSYVAWLMPEPDDFGVRPDTQIQAVLVNNGPSMGTESIALWLDDVKLPVKTVQAGNTITATWDNLGTFLAGGSQHQARFTYLRPDLIGPASPSWNFTVASLPLLKPSWATPISSVSTRPGGFRGVIHKARNDAPADLFPNSPERAESQLANRIIDPDTGSPYANEAAGEKGDGSFVETETINYEQSGVEEGIGGDRPFPNLDATDHNNIAMQVVTYLKLPRGAHRLAVACDDGFYVAAGPSAAGSTNILTVRTPGGGTVEWPFDLLVETPGVYAFRLLFFEGSGGADIEWYSIDLSTGNRVLINAPGGIEAYQTRAGDGTDAVAPPPSVPLSIQPIQSGVSVSWPKTTPAFKLQSTDALSGSNWTLVNQAAVEEGATLRVDQPAASGARYYRLIYP